MEAVQCAADGEMETKIQVDRKRLEAMIIGEAFGEDATTFFARVERFTGARVCWPSRLKIRAKTKKDPFVKLIGAPQNVQKATEMIEAQLRVKKEKVTLKIEVSHSLHSQIIGRGGKNTQKIMRDTNCHIHFPDSNKSTANSPTLAKNDQVSISGCAKDVERAREMIRAICPLTVSVTIQLGLGRNLYALQSRLDPAQLQSHFPPTDGDLTVQFLHQGPPLLGTLHFLMRSSARNELDMLRAFGRVCTLIGVFPSGAELLCSSQFELRPAALPSTGSVRWIAFRTNTQIQLNDQGLLISGSLEGIFIARKLLTGLLPVSLQFENPSDQLSTLCPFLPASFESELDVQIGERRRRKGTKPGTTTGAEERDFAIGTYEANLFGAYTARNRLLKIKEDPEKDQFPRDSESAAFMRSMCRESLMADQQGPLAAAAASVAFANSAARSFGQSSDARNWRAEAKKPIGVDVAKCLEKAEGPKSPDPQESPIAAGLLAGAKSVNSQKGEFRKVLDRERMLLKANRAIYNSPMLDFGQEEDKHRTPTDLWAGYGFSSSLPVDLLRFGRTGGEMHERRGRPIVGMGPEGKAEKEEKRKEEEKEEEGSWRRKQRQKEEEEEDEKGNWRRAERDNGTQKEPFFGQSIMGPSPAIPQASTLFTRSNSSKLNPSSSFLRNSIQLVALREEEEEEPNRSEKADQKETEGARSARMSQRLDAPSPAKVHPRVAALQMTEQRKPKFTMSTGLFDTFRSSAGGGAGGASATSAVDQNSSALPAAASGAAPIWDIRVLSEPALVLAQLGLAEHVPFFREQEIDMQAFLLLDEQCLRTLGVTTLGARRKIMHAIMKLRDSAQRHGMYSL